MAMKGVLSFALTLLAMCLPCSSRYAGVWDGVTEVLQQSVKNGVFPGATALVGDRSGVLYSQAVGSYTYGHLPPFFPNNTTKATPPMRMDTRFDMASCTKVISTTTAIALLYQDGHLDLNTYIADPYLLGPEFAQNDKSDITVRNCLLHNAGYPPDPNPNYWYPEFGCPATSQPQPPENWSCRQRIYKAFLNQTVVRGPNEKYVYSDLSFITLMFVAGRVVSQHASEYGITEQDLLPGCLDKERSDASVNQCYYEAFVRLRVFKKASLAATGFMPQREVWGQCAPAENDTVYLHRVIQGQVSDGNAYALGGISGHAGLFSTTLDIASFMHQLMFEQDSGVLYNRSTYELFIREYNHSQSSRAYGWNTNDPGVFDMGWNQSCGPLSNKTFMHLGYTGTMVCADPVMEVYVILLTNRVYPTALNIKIERARQVFSAAVVDALKSDEVSYYRAVRQAYLEFQAHGGRSRGGRGTVKTGSTKVIPFDYPLYKQCNASWGKDIMVTQTICAVGCLMSSISMALHGKDIEIDGVPSNPGVLNHWLQHNNGYTPQNDLKESVIPAINSTRIKWVGAEYNLNRTTVVKMIEQKTIVIINVDDGHHFVLVTGYDTDPAKEDVWYVNDPGFNREYYTTADIVGYRIFTMA